VSDPGDMVGIQAPDRSRSADGTLAGEAGRESHAYCISCVVKIEPACPAGLVPWPPPSTSSPAHATTEATDDHVP
jgi:hypothetical protein